MTAYEDHTDGVDGADGADAVIVGAGPVGMFTALLLGLRGRRVVVVERRPRPYGLPRAVALDQEACRLLAGAGLGERLAAIIEEARTYEWRTADGRPLLRFAWADGAPGGWPQTSMFAQPDLEDLLAERLARLPSVTVLRGWEADVPDVPEEAGEVRVTVCDGAGRSAELHAAYLVGCDGAGSAVRRAMGVPVTDLGFTHDWLIVDVVPPADRTWDPVNLQLCDPARPVTAVSGGPGRRRFEFMRLPGESVAELVGPGAVWRLLAPWGLTPAGTRVERHALYTFRAAVADRWRRGRVLLAGDAAHVMPPFAGQGLCTGLRDAANLAWKLELVLAGAAPDALLDTYEEERAVHARATVTASVDLGRIICVQDPRAAAERDEEMGAAHGGTLVDTLPAQPLTAGLFRPGPGPGGTLAPQGPADPQPPGFTLVTTGDPAGLLGADSLAYCRSAGIGTVRVPRPPYADLFTPGDRQVALVRPDLYVYGAAAEDGADALVAELRARLTGCAVLPR
ncbi:bifunctional 3-(3-hydroxy-phenyl)propionate/3-hydroxycinnamic acid hydroxylase [Streptomyces sp. NPDC050095]|uniref:bifunctional 3-(3-hydroxy-phenyl)propionate/3-hydroxycinnamic acid hydroxylase n=1 Tax=unclassified Streptomyces TaxID=2593676 RepID=UPI0034481DD5